MMSENFAGKKVERGGGGSVVSSTDGKIEPNEAFCHIPVEINAKASLGVHEGQ